MAKNPSHMEKAIIKIRYAFAGLPRRDINGLVRFVEGISKDIKTRRQEEGAGVEDSNVGSK